MTIARLLPLHIHGALETALAVVMMAAAFVLGFGPVAMITSLTLGGLILAVALVTHIGDDQDTLPISTHLAFDLAFAIAMGGAAVAFALNGDAGATALLGAGAASLILLSSLTRYSPRPA
jgi:hypothetical protein